ncbi:MAG TPA: CPBP family intramembrane glutamic endopeptidase, partial [bacterium]
VRLQTRVADSQKALELLDLSETTSGSCRYCGEVLNESEFNSDLGILHCLKPQCLTAYQAEVKSLTRLCPSCGKEITYPNFICGNCGKKLKEIPVTLEPMELSPTPSSQDEKWKLGWAVLLWFFFFSIDLVPSSIYCGLNYWQGILPDVLSARWVSTLSELMCVFLTLFLVKNFKNLSWLESINFLGFKSMNPRQLLAGALILIPILASEFLALQGYQKEGVLVLLKRDWVGRAIHILVGAGFFEEILYRGFLFQCLRRGRSFFSAAILASGLWALSHLSHLIPFYGPEHESFDQTLSLMFRVFVDGLLGAYLFEKGGNNIWGWMLVHVGYDSCSLMNTQGGDFYASSLPENFSDMGDWSSVLLTVPIILWL